LCATPFSYETGFYFKGKKTYHVQVCGFCTIIGALFLMASSFVLFEPLLSGRVIQIDLESEEFNALHREEQPDGVEYFPDVPGSIQQFFGRKVPYREPVLDLDDFLEQYGEIDVYGATTCNDTANILECSVSNDENPILKTECTNYARILPTFKKKFGYSTKNVYKLVKA
jgi:hypothetical protein